MQHENERMTQSGMANHPAGSNLCPWPSRMPDPLERLAASAEAGHALDGNGVAMMKIFSSTVLAAFLLAAPVIADAAATSGAGDSASAYSANARHPYAVLDFQNGIHLTPTSPVRGGNAEPLDGTLRLLNRTGSGR
jgi:hypothetical protein